MAHQKAAAFATAIGISRPPERLLALLRQHDRLLADVARKRKTLARDEEEVRRVASEVARRLAPVIEESRRIDAELHGLFAELLEKSKLSKRARHAVRRVYEQLQDEGVLSAEARRRRAGAAWTAPADFGQAQDDDQDDDGTAGAPRRPNAAGEVPGAAPAQASPTLRALFLRLARALHPDRVKDGGEKEARTETMKEINRAYRAGDVARLAELDRKLNESAFNGSGESGRDGDGSGDADRIDEKCAALEQTNQALRQQLRKLRRELRELRDSDMGRMAAEVERRRHHGSKADPFAELEADGEGDLARFRVLRDYVRAFRDGELSLDEFVMGPPANFDDDGDDGRIDLDELAELFSGAAPQPPRRARRRKRR